MVKSILLGSKWIALATWFMTRFECRAGQGIQLPFIRIYWAPTLNLEAALVIYTWLGPRMGYIIHDSLRYVDL